jgi:type VI secretion system secreted protein VgrG
MQSPITQENLPVKINCSGLPEEVAVMKATISETISNLFRANVFIQTPKDIDLLKIVNLPATLSIEIDKENIRYFSGIIENASFENIPSTIQTETDSILFLEISPFLSITQYSTKYRTFQELATKEIIQSVLKENGITNVKINLRSRGIQKRVFCVQYGESDFHFISRLMEEEGIFYYFEHKDGKDLLCISDDSTSGPKIKTNLIVRKASSEGIIYHDSAFNISLSSSLGITRTALRSYNEKQAVVTTGIFEDKSNRLMVGTQELYMQSFLEKAEGDQLSKILSESSNSFLKVLSGRSHCPELYPGSIVKIGGSVTENHNGEFFIISVKHTITQITEESNIPTYVNSFEATPSKVQFRPRQTHFKNRIYGYQTAIVTGTSGEEIFCDENSSIKVKFHWDSRTQKDEKSSPWIRVAQAWAGGSFGSLIIPRVGMEVVVVFLNGDPDYPIVIGCVYNGVNKPPSNYPKNNNTVSSFYTRSSKSSQGFNELRFTDATDTEEIYIHGQKDMVSVIENNVTQTLNMGSKTVILESKKDSVQNILTIKKGDNKLILNQGNYIIILDKGSQSITLKEGDQSITLSKGNLTIDVTGGINIKATKDIVIDSTGGAVHIKSARDTIVESKGKIILKAAQAFDVDCMNGTIKAKIALETSSLTTKIDAKTSMTLTGLAIKISANAALNMSAKAAATLSANAMTTISGTAGLSLGGAMIKLN